MVSRVGSCSSAGKSGLMQWRWEQAALVVKSSWDSPSTPDHADPASARPSATPLAVCLRGGRPEFEDDDEENVIMEIIMMSK
eukprot:CAMPEP_0206435486 /NCGR_PEP_ID=MMETSP0324_2-20121206/9893_1 /ASSEMBLY_ACC=CAM_ASM_000836 /TAXON_ID=2866 /ORGANISM="Crypthecodinium cohnii, Strain Seligo" /LENGTH=81 /DNA_ID=CAMNT_0053902423 /DNA_START=734 /DNA_END=979 /DNA_ORIENTATION=+